MSFSESLKQHRINAGFSSAKEFAARLGLSYSTYVAYENTDREPRFDVLIKIADILNVSIDELLERHVEKRKMLLAWLESNGFYAKSIKHDGEDFLQITTKPSSYEAERLSFTYFHHAKHPSRYKSRCLSTSALQESFCIPLDAVRLLKSDKRGKSLTFTELYMIFSAMQKIRLSPLVLEISKSPKYKELTEKLLAVNPCFFKNYYFADLIPGKPVDIPLEQVK